MLVLIRGVFIHNSRVSLWAFGTIVIVSIWGLIGVFATTIGCSVSAIIPRRGDDHCINSVSIFQYPSLGGPSVRDGAISRIVTTNIYILTYQISWLKAGAVIDVITEMVTICLPMVGFHSSPMAINRKVVVVMAFFTRLPYVSRPSAFPSFKSIVLLTTLQEHRFRYQTLSYLLEVCGRPSASPRYCPDCHLAEHSSFL